MTKKQITKGINLVDDFEPYLEEIETGRKIILSNEVYETLKIFTDSVGHAITDAELAHEFWGEHWETEGKEIDSVRSRIFRARAKLNEVFQGAGKQYIRRGHNRYKFASDLETLECCRCASDNQHPQEETFSLPDINAVDPNSVQPMEYWQLLNLTVPGSNQKYDAKIIGLMLKRNDYKLFPGLMHSPELAGDYINTWAKHLSKRPESFKYLVAGNNDIVGNFSFVSLTREQGQACVAGDFLEESFDISQTQPLSTAGVKDILYILNFSINDAYATPRNRNLLKQLFFSTLQTYAEYDNYFRQIIVNVFEAAQGEEFKKWGFVKLEKRRNVHYGELYALDLIPYPESLFTALSKNSMLKDINLRLKELYDGISTTFD